MGLLLFLTRHTMNKIWILLPVLFAGCSPRDSYNPDQHLDAKEKVALVDRIVRYTAKLPDKANDTTKFDPGFDGYYQEQASKHILKLYYQSSDEQFFLLTRRAPSIYEKYVAIGGRLLVDEKDSLVSYEEVFRTWKMLPDTLDKRAAVLFDRMVKGESLDPYLTKNSNGVEYIEFPDEHVFYDKASRKWKSNQFGSIEEMLDEQ